MQIPPTVHAFHLLFEHHPPPPPYLEFCLYLQLQVLVPYMGGITFLDYVKELPKGKREAKGATKGGYATKQKTPTGAKAAAAAEAPAAKAGSSARALPGAGGGGAEESKGGDGGGGGSGDPEADAIADKIASKVRLAHRLPCITSSCTGVFGMYASKVMLDYRLFFVTLILLTYVCTAVYVCVFTGQMLI